MPLVFVHGVNVRKGKMQEEIDAWNQVEKARNAAFRNVTFADQIPSGAPMHFENPYWGDLASKFAWNLDCIPSGKIEAFGPQTDKLSEIALVTTTPEAAAATMNPDQTLVTLAKTASLAHALDAAIAATLHTQNFAGVTEEELAAFAARALAYAEAHPPSAAPDWLVTVADDNDFLDKLLLHTNQWAESAAGAAAPSGVEAFGPLDNVLNWVKGGAQQLGNALVSAKNAAVGVVVGGVGGAIAGGAAGAGGSIATRLVGAVRPATTMLIGRFFGDVFLYLQERGTDTNPGPIPKHVIKAIDAAIAAKTPQDNRLILVGHSMGGNILYDILTYYRTDIQCDLLITAGTQVGLFEELKIFQKRDPSIGAPKTVARPANVRKWINVFDMTDIFGFTTEKIFADVEDFKFDTETLPVVSHGAYFERPRFFARLRERVNKALA
jgi:hypothetical protein